MTFTTEQLRELARAANPIPDPEALAAISNPTLDHPVKEELGSRVAPSRPTHVPGSRLRLLPAHWFAVAAVALSLGLVLGLNTMTSVVYQAGPSQVVPPVVFTDESCTTEPIDALAPGLFTLPVENDSWEAAHFELMKIEVTYDEFAAFFAESNEVLQAGQPPRVSEDGGGVTPPAHTSLDWLPYVLSGESGELEADLIVGTYAVLCLTGMPTEDYTGVFTVGPYIVVD